MFFNHILEDQTVALRPLELSDLDLLYRWENDSSVWLVSGTTVPFSKELLTQYIQSAEQDIYAVRQLRLVITAKKQDGKAVGAVDLFDFDPLNKRAGIGILIDPSARKQGYAKAALSVIAEYARLRLNLHQIYCGIPACNTASIRLFESEGFVRCGVRKDWIFTPEGWVDEIAMQKLL